LSEVLEAFMSHRKYVTYLRNTHDFIQGILELHTRDQQVISYDANRHLILIRMNLLYLAENLQDY